jgi:hypothetical protein
MARRSVRTIQALARVLLAALPISCGESGHGDHDATVVGTVLDAATREPLAGVDVRGPHDSRATSDAAGRFRLESLHAGEAGEVVARSDDGLEARVALRPLSPGELEIVLHLRRADASAGTAAPGD